MMEISVQPDIDNKVLGEVRCDQHDTSHKRWWMWRLSALMTEHNEQYHPRALLRRRLRTLEPLLNRKPGEGYEDGDQI